MPEHIYDGPASALEVVSEKTEITKQWAIVIQPPDGVPFIGIHESGEVDEEAKLEDFPAAARMVAGVLRDGKDKSLSFNSGVVVYFGPTGVDISYSNAQHPLLSDRSRVFYTLVSEEMLRPSPDGASETMNS